MGHIKYALEMQQGLGWGWVLPAPQSALSLLGAAEAPWVEDWACMKPNTACHQCFLTDHKQELLAQSAYYKGSFVHIRNFVRMWNVEQMQLH